MICECFSCKFCEPDDVDPETLNVTFWCDLHYKAVNPSSYCSDFTNKECYYE